MRKTIHVSAIVHEANTMLAGSHFDLGQARRREGVIALLERVLLDTGNYKGFSFEDGANGLIDGTRRHYYSAAQ